MIAAMTLPWLPRPVGPARTVAQLGTTPAPHLDGLLGTRLWSEAVVADVGLSAADRARSAVHGGSSGEHRASRVSQEETVGQRGDGVVCLRAAAWIHLGGEVPPVLEIAVPRALRARFGGVRYRCVPVAERDVVVLGGVRVTTPLATACDLALVLGQHRRGEAVAHPDDGQHRAALLALLRHDVDGREVRTRLLATRRPHTRAAQAVLAELLSPRS